MTDNVMTQYASKYTYIILFGNKDSCDHSLPVLEYALGDVLLWKQFNLHEDQAIFQ